MANLTTEQKLQKANVRAMGHPTLRGMSGLILFGKTLIVDDPKAMPTAATDGYNTYYGRDFIDKLSLPALTFTVLHENIHKALRHIMVWKRLWDKYPDGANICADLVTNLIIYEADKDVGLLELPHPKTLLDTRIAGWDVGRVFKWLDDKASGRTPEPLVGTPIRDYKGVPVMLLDELKFSKGGGGQGFGNGSGGQQGKQITNAPPGDQHLQNGTKGMTPEEVKALDQQLDQAIRAAKLQSKLGAGQAQLDFDEADSKVPWQEAMANFFRNMYAGGENATWARPNRRFISRGMYIPSQQDKVVPPLLLAIDTSGSMGKEQLSEMMSEIRSLCDMFAIQRVYVAYWDTRVASWEVYESGETKSIVDVTKPAGGGGTSPSCIHPWMEQNDISVHAAVVFTDGYVGADWGKWDRCNDRVLWVIKGDSRAVPSVGQIAYQE